MILKQYPALTLDFYIYSIEGYFTIPDASFQIPTNVKKIYPKYRNRAENKHRARAGRGAARRAPTYQKSFGKVSEGTLFQKGSLRKAGS